MHHCKLFPRLRFRVPIEPTGQHQREIGEGGAIERSRTRQSLVDLHFVTRRVSEGSWCTNASCSLAYASGSDCADRATPKGVSEGAPLSVAELARVWWNCRFVPNSGEFGYQAKRHFLRTRGSATRRHGKMCRL